MTEQEDPPLAAWAIRAADRAPSVARTRLRSAQRAQQVVFAARRQIIEQGGGFTMQDLARSAGVAVQTLYKYFPSRDHVVLAVLEDLIGEAVTLLEEQAATLPDPVALRGDPRLRHDRGGRRPGPVPDQRPGADAAILCTGVATGEQVGAAVDAIRKAGVCVLVGLPAMATDTSIPVSIRHVVLYQKRIQESLFGACSPFKDIPGCSSCTCRAV